MCSVFIFSFWLLLCKDEENKNVSVEEKRSATRISKIIYKKEESAGAAADSKHQTGDFHSSPHCSIFPRCCKNTVVDCSC